METTPVEARCNRCQRPIPVDAPVPFCPPCIAAGALRPKSEGSDAEEKPGLNWPALGLSLCILGILAFLIVQSVQHHPDPEAPTATNAPSGTNPLPPLHTPVP